MRLGWNVRKRTERQPVIVGAALLAVVLLAFIPAPGASAATNVAPLAAVTASSQNTASGQSAAKAIDGVVTSTDPTKEWATLSGGAGSWIKLTWASAVKITAVTLYDRPNMNDQATAGTLTFSDGTTVAVGSLPNAGTAKTLKFSTKTVTWVKFTVSKVSSTTRSVGLAEIQVTGDPAVAPPVASFTFSPSAPTAGQTLSFTDTSASVPTAWEWTFGDGLGATVRNPVHVFAAPGTYTVRLVARNAGGTNSLSKTITVAAPAAEFNMAQAISDGAQRTTLGFSGLAMMTGNLYAQSFFPPGKVADYTGFQYLRDNDPDGMGHNTSFLTRVANNVIYILNDAQFERLKTLAVDQQTAIQQYGYKRFPLMQAFRRLISGDLPTGAGGLSLAAVKTASRELYAIDGQISFDRALLYAGVIGSLDPTQKAYLDAMKGKGFNSWPDITKDQIKQRMSTLPQGTAVAVMTYAGDLFSWYAGSVEADVYFCPERHGTYYGSFYMKDAPAVGHEGYSISTQLTATAGSALSDSSKGYVTTAQAAAISGLVATQRQNLYGSSSGGIVGVRTQIATLLRSLLLPGTSSDAVKAQVLALSATYGDLDGENNYNYATVFGQVYRSLSADQKTALDALRHSILSGTYADGTAFDFTVCTTPYLYSAPIADTSVLAPYLTDTDRFFQ